MEMDALPFQSKSCLASDLQPPTPIRSQGLRKRILRAGISWQTPYPGDEVQVHYRGRIDGGESLSSSYDKGIPFKFKLGQCEVIGGWDEGIATMKKGEAAEFTIPPNLGYGECGSPPLIPPNATLIFEIELLSWCTVRDLKADGGVLKKVIREGSGWATPKDAYEVTINYEVMLENGKTLLKSSNVEFYLHEGHLCPAMGIALKTMRKGEKADLSVRFPYGLTREDFICGEIEDVILPDSYLRLYIELVSWKTVMDVSGDKKVLKKITRAGEGLDQPNEGSLAKVIYTCQGQDGTELEGKGSVEKPFEYTCMGGQIDERLDRAILTMRKGEQATVSIHGAPGSPPSISYEVELEDFTKDKPFWKMDIAEKIEASERTKCEGNELFKSGRLELASSKYERAAKYLEYDHSFTEDEKRQADALRLSCYLNNAACKLKMGEVLEASKFCTKALEVDSNSVKALYRRSQAYLRANEFEKAETDIRKALIIDPNNRDVKITYKEIKEKQKEHGRYEAQIFSSMLARPDALVRRASRSNID